MENKFQGSERRRNPRIRAEFVVIYQVDKPIEVRMRIGHKDVPALMLDLSEGGMAILTNYNIPAATNLSMKFTLINSYAEDKNERVHSMEMLGQVRYNIFEKKEYRLGIYFTQITPEHKTAISNFVDMAMRR